MKAKLFWPMVALVLCSCREQRERDRAPLDLAQVQPLLDRSCVSCHSGTAPAADVRLDSYYGMLGCDAKGKVLTQPESADAPLIAVLERDDHAQRVSREERQLLLRWVERGAPGRQGVVHGTGIMNPRSAEWHGRLAAQSGFSAIRDPSAELSCGRCHEGAPVRPPSVQRGAPEAPSCTSCHDEPRGVLSCSTCHGAQMRAYPPRDRCYFPTSKPDAHDAHLTKSGYRAEPLGCDTCHALPGERIFEGSHVNGKVELQFSPLAGENARYQEQEQACSVACHTRGGEHGEPYWTETLDLTCNSCHQTPPPDHYPEPCSRCHAEMGSTRDSLRPGALHLNGQVDVGRGGGSCGACHGDGDDDPLPRDALHAAHAQTQLTTPIMCTNCHEVPSQVHAPGHLNGQIDVRLAERGVLPGTLASFEANDKRCDNVACHGGALRSHAQQPRWLSVPEPQGCTLCHGTPPPPPHVQQVSCGGGLCHGAEVRGAGPAYGITSTGRGLHIDGQVQAAGQ